MSNKNFGKSINGKGYYIALILCAVAIGISGYLYYSNTNDVEDPQLGGQDASVGATVPSENDLEVVATQPAEVEPTQVMQATEPSPAVTEKTIQTAAPVEGEIIMVYAMDSLDYNPTTRDWRTHNGVDIAAEEGSKVCAAAEGTVYTVYEDETMGMTVVIRHEDGYVTRYSSLAEEVTVKAGDHVELGQQIGCVGNTALLETAIGSHVHFAVSHNDQAMDPEAFLAME